MRLWIIGLMMVGFLVTGLAQAQAITMGQAIDKAGRQRMLTQKMIKAYALEGQGLYEGARYEMDEAAALFSEQLKELEAFAATTEERAQVRKIKLLWSELVPELAKTPRASLAPELNDMAELLLKESHALVGMLEARSGTNKGKLVNMSGRQRMLSQRLAKIYLLETWGLNSDQLSDQFYQAEQDFGLALETLIAASENTDAISAELAKVDKQWRVFGISNFSKKYNTRVPNLVVRSMNRILKRMNTITGMYAALE